MFGLEFWHWWTLGVLLITAEAVTPGFVFGWLGAASVMTGVVLVLLPWLGWQLQLLTFAGLALLSVPGWLLYVRRFAGPRSLTPLNRRGVQHIGRHCTVVEPIENGRGRVRLGDSSWVAAGEDMPAGARVRVVGVDGTILLVERDPPEAAGRAA